METISSVEFQRNFGRYQDKAMRDTVIITNNGRKRLALMAIEEYERLKRRDRQVMTLADFTEEDIDDLKQAQASLEAEGLNGEWEE